MTQDAVLERLIQACLHWTMSEQNEPNANYDAELEYCEDLILDAARALVAAHNDGYPESIDLGLDDQVFICGEEIDG